MKSSSFAKSNRTAVALILAAVVVACLLLSVPAYSFDSAIYTKKSSNTFVGDEKYEAALAEVNEVADEYRASGFDVTVDETVTERTNSKGEVSSLVTFSIRQKFTKSGWSFLTSGLNSSKVLLAIVVCLVLSAAFAFCGSSSSLDVPVKQLSSSSKFLRSAACWLALAALLLVPVFHMMNTYIMSRRIVLYTNDLVTEGKDEFFAMLDKFLFNGASGDKAEATLKNLSFKTTGAVWGLVPCAILMIISGIQLRFGSVKHTLLRGLLYAFVVIICVIFLYPYYVMLVTGLRSAAETNDMYFMHMFPTEWKFSNLKDIVSRGVPRYLLNSLLIAGGATAIAMFCGIPAAYSLARKSYKGKNLFLGFVIMSQMFSPVVLLIGIAQLMSTLKLNDTVWGLMLINAAFNQAFAIWLLRGTFVSISPEMEQAALIDGCNTFQSLIKVLLPMAAPGIVTTLIFVFINTWNEYTISTVLIATASNRPITVGITQFSSFNMIEWQYLFAASLLATIPVVILFACIEKHLTAGLTSGGVKG